VPMFAGSQTEMSRIVTFFPFSLGPFCAKTAAQMTLGETALVPGDLPDPWSLVLGPWIEN
jgi:hypothetical protein